MQGGRHQTCGVPNPGQRTTISRDQTVDSTPRPLQPVTTERGGWFGIRPGARIFAHRPPIPPCGPNRGGDTHRDLPLPTCSRRNESKLPDNPVLHEPASVRSHSCTTAKRPSGGENKPTIENMPTTTTLPSQRSPEAHSPTVEQQHPHQLRSVYTALRGKEGSKTAILGPYHYGDGRFPSLWSLVVAFFPLQSRQRGTSRKKQRCGAA